ncbi:MAG: hypothetical protein ABIO83_04550 [Ilumatobacteraceae bacterium]
MVGGKVTTTTTRVVGGDGATTGAGVVGGSVSTTGTVVEVVVVEVVVEVEVVEVEVVVEVVVEVGPVSIGLAANSLTCTVVDVWATSAAASESSPGAAVTANTTSAPGTPIFAHSGQRM